MKWTCYCVKRVQIRRFFWSIFSCIWTEYGDLRIKCPYSVQIRENVDQEKLRIWTLFAQCVVPLCTSSFIFVGFQRPQSLWLPSHLLIIKFNLVLVTNSNCVTIYDVDSVFRNSQDDFGSNISMNHNLYKTTYRWALHPFFTKF